MRYHNFFMRAIVKNASVIGNHQLSQSGPSNIQNKGSIRIIDKSTNEGELNYNSQKLDSSGCNANMACDEMDLFEKIIKHDIFEYIKVR